MPVGPTAKMAVLQSDRRESAHAVLRNAGVMSRPFVLLAIAGALVVPAVYSVTRPDPVAKAKADGLQTLVSDPYRLDKIYRSMEGPWPIQSGIHLAAGAKSGGLWGTGLETDVVDPTVQKPISQEFVCHSNLTFAGHGRTPV